MGNPIETDIETTRLLEFFAAFGIPTEDMRASPGIQLDGEVLRLAPEFVFPVKDLTVEQLAAIESTLHLRIVR